MTAESRKAALPTPQATFDATVLHQLACPACHGDLRAQDARLVCSACGRKYPSVDGIPALLAERAENAMERRSAAPKPALSQRRLKPGT